MQDPFFILGNPRSGTTLFRLMLNAHSRICVPPESGFVHWWYPKYKFWDVKCSDDNKQISEYIKDILSSKKIELWNLESGMLKNKINEIKPSNYAELSMCVYLSYAGDDIDLIGDKNNYYINHLEDISAIFPNAKYLHIARDGRDVACSYREIMTLKSISPYKPKLPYDISEIAREWAENIDRIESFIASKKAITIKYEDLIQSPNRTLHKVCNFLGVEFMEMMLDYFQNNNEPQLMLDWKRKTLESINPSNSMKYKHTLTASEIKLFNDLAKEQLSLFDYEF